MTPATTAPRRTGDRRRPPQPWGRGKLLAILAGAVGCALLLVTGVVLFAWRLIADDPGEDPGTTPDAQRRGWVVNEATLPSSGPVRREQIASTPMLAVDDPRAYREGPVATTAVEPILVPPATETGLAGIPTGFPRTPEGALAQLAAIDVAVIQGMSVPAAHEVYQAWSDGQTDPAEWVMTRNVATFLTAANQSGQVKESGLVVTATPAGGQVKGTDGPDWVLGCVLLELHAQFVEEAQASYGHCEAMTWKQGRWVIDTTHPVAPAPSTWPGTELAVQAGWRPWATDH